MSMKLKKTAKTMLMAGGVAAVMAVLPIATSYTGVAIGQVVAQEEQKEPERKTRKTPALRNSVYEKLQEIQTAVEAGDLKLALERLNDMREAGGKNALNSYELANMWNMYAFVYISEEKFDQAVKAYEQLLAQPDLPEQMEVSTKYQIALLYLQTEQYEKAVKGLEEWFQVATNPNPDAYILLGQAYYQTKNYKKAIANVEIAFEKEAEKGRVIKENWYQLAMVLYYELSDIPNVVKTLESLVTLYSKGTYWVQLSQMYGEQKKELLQMVTLEAAYVQGALTKEGELMTMAGLYAANDVPYKAAKVVEKAIKEDKVRPTRRNLEFLGNQLTVAQEVEKAIDPLRQAAKVAEDGMPSFRLARTLNAIDRYEEAETAALDAIRKGGLKRPDDAYMVLGQTRFYQGKLEEARKAFREAAKDKRSEKFARQWLLYIGKEIERLKQLDA